jgi:predicted Rossmann fold nucleotide-binding protein DprA/Smf involved in DNA uptake
MKLAIIGSRGLKIENLADYVRENVTEIVSGGAKGVDSDAEKYANANGIKLTVFLPEYSRYKKGATRVRNRQIVDYSDQVLALWDGGSKGTVSVIEYSKKQGKKVTVIIKNQ